MISRPVHLAAFAILLPALAGSAGAQLHSPQVSLHRKSKPVDYSWLWSFAQPAPDGRENQLALDPRFQTLLHQQFTALQSFWANNEPLSSVAEEFLSGPPGQVLAIHNRFLAADASVAHFPPNRGLFFADLGTPDPLFVFAATDWISDNRTTEDKDATYTLWVFPNRPLDPTHLPPALVSTVARWTAEPVRSADPDTAVNAPENITRVFLIDPDSTPHPIAPATIGAHTTLPAETTTDTKVPS